MPPHHFTCPGTLVSPGKEPGHISLASLGEGQSGQRSHCQKQEPWVSPLLCGSSLTRVSLFCRRTHQVGIFPQVGCLFPTSEVILLSWVGAPVP